MRFAAKDLIDVAGHATGAGNPDWLRTHAAATTTAPAVTALLEAAATLTAKTITDELACSMSGINPHYGTPLNSAAPDRLPGGSSSGSAAAVAAGLVDFALGTDTSGSVRVPASYCGVYGMRPTHDRVSAEGVFPLAPTFDTVGWMARDAAVLSRVGQALLDWSPPETRLSRLLICTDAFAYGGADTWQSLLPLVRRLSTAFETTEPCTLYSDGMATWLRAHCVLVEDEFWQAHGDWIRQTNPVFGPDVGQRMAGAKEVDAPKVEEARAARGRVRSHLERLLTGDTVLCMPTAPTIAPAVGTTLEELSLIEVRAIVLTCAASLAGLPQVTLPWATCQGAPMGLSFLAGRGRDEALLELIPTLLDARETS